MTKLTITGGAGFIGSSIVESPDDQCDHITVIDRLVSPWCVGGPIPISSVCRHRVNTDPLSPPEF
jgi:nucleoside-diphosphate-sugar epimerase